MKTWSISLFILSLLILITSSDTSARRTHLTAEQLDRLQNIQTILTTVITLTEEGRGAADSIQNTVTQRLREIGYTVTTDPQQPHDVEFKVKCEERKTWTGTTPEGSDAELTDAPARLWKGPACLFTYSLDGKDLGWRKEVRTSFEDTIAAAQTEGKTKSGQYALEQLAQRVAVYDFPVLISAEWGQTQRLLKLVQEASTHRLRKLKILSVLHDLHSEEALPELTEIMKDKDLAQEAIVALAGVGIDSLPILIDLFETTKQLDIQTAAAKALGDLAGSTGDPRCIPPLLQYLNQALPRIKTSEDINFPVLTAVVWSLGKLRDDNSMAPMAELNQRVWLIYDKSPEMAELREATSWTYKQIDLDGHVS